MSSAAATTHMELMRAIGSKEGFDPMPPSQHGYFLFSRDMQTRAVAWVWSKTIRAGKGNRRYAYAKDARGALGLKHAQSDLGWTQPNTSTVFKKLREQGLVRIDEQGRIWLRGDVPEPVPEYRRIEGEDEAHDPNDHLCNEIPNKRLRLYLQSLPQDESRQATARYLKLREWRKRAEADAMAAARAAGDDFEKAFYDEIGFEDEQRRGRPKLERDKPTLQLALLEQPDIYTQKWTNADNGISVHSADPPSVQNENQPVQKPHPYVFSELESSELASSKTQPAKPLQNGTRKTAIREAVREAVARSRLRQMDGKECTDQTLDNLATELDRLESENEIRDVLEILEDKCRTLTRGPSTNKTWGWVVMAIRGEVEKRAGAAQADMRDQIRSISAGKGMPS